MGKYVTGIEYLQFRITRHHLDAVVVAKNTQIWEIRHANGGGGDSLGPGLGLGSKVIWLTLLGSGVPPGHPDPLKWVQAAASADRFR